MTARDPLASDPLVTEWPEIRQLPGVLADSLNQYDLLRAIRQIDDYCAALAIVRTIHAQNLCRIANHAIAARDTAIAANLSGDAS